MSLKHHNFIYKCCIQRYFEIQKIQLKKEETSDREKERTKKDWHGITKLHSNMKPVNKKRDFAGTFMHMPLMTSQLVKFMMLREDREEMPRSI